MAQSRTAQMLITGLAFLVMLITLNYLASRHPLRVDLTDGNRYTLSPATHSILSGLDDVVTLRVYMSGDLPPPLMALKRDIGDMLTEFRNASRDMIRIEYIDPLADPADEQRALIMGIAPVQLGVIEKDRQQLAKVYLGMAVLHGDRLEILPVIQSIGTLEYRLAQAIVKVTTTDTATIGWWTPQEADPVGGGYGMINQLLKERYELVKIDTATLEKLHTSHVRALVIASPGLLGTPTLDTIDSYLKEGGKVILLVDRWKVDANLRATPRKTDITELISRYGLAIESNMVVDRSNAMASFAGQVATYHLPYPFWVLVRPEGLADDDPITGEMGGLVLPWTSSIAQRADDAAAIHVLARSTDEATTVSGDALSVDPETAGNDLMSGRKLASQVLALRLNSPVDLLIVGNGRFVQDNFLRRFPANATFLENAVDVYAMSDKLIDVRSRMGIERPIAMLSDDARLVLRALNMAIGPLLVLIIGTIVMIIRRWRSRRMRASYGSHS